jgi:hypothetical protein
MATTVFTTTFNSNDSSELNGGSLRQAVKVTAALQAQVRVTFRGSSTTGCKFDHCSIGKCNQQPPTTTSDTTAVPVELTFAGGGHGVTIAGGASATSDWVTSPAGVGANQWVYITMDTNAAGHTLLAIMNTVDAGELVFADINNGFYNQATPSYDSGNFAVNVCVLTIETQGAGPTPITIGAGSYSFGGQAATLKRARKFSAAAGSYAFTGSAATMKRGQKLTAGAGSYLFSGTAATLKEARKLAAGVGSYQFSGSVAIAIQARKLLAANGGYVFTGAGATLLQARLLACAAGAYNFSGSDVALATLASKSIAAEVGGYVISGDDATFLMTKVLPAFLGQYTFGGRSTLFSNSGEQVETTIEDHPFIATIGQLMNKN